MGSNIFIPPVTPPPPLNPPDLDGDGVISDEEYFGWFFDYIFGPVPSFSEPIFIFPEIDPSQLAP